MEVRVHHDPGEFWAVAEPLYTVDPIRHTLAITVARRLVQAPEPTDAPPLLVSLWDGDKIAAAVLRTPPWPLVSSGVPAGAVNEVAAALVKVDPDLPSVTGPRDITEPFGAAWSRLTGATVRETLSQRLYRLAELEPPVVPGQARMATEGDLPLLAGWRRDFELEAFGYEREPGKQGSTVGRAMAMGNGQALWEVDGQPVSWGAASVPTERMSRVGPVYTPPELRGRGYGTAVTAAVSRWALDAGAENVLLFTDLTNPISNSIYQRIGYRPVYDSTELEFERPAAPTLDV